MYKPASDKTVPLVVFANRRRIKDKVIHQLLVGESRERYERRYCNYNDG